MKTNVGLVTASRATPRPAARPRTKHVFPDPSSPQSASSSPPKAARPVRTPRRSVSEAECVRSVHGDAVVLRSLLPLDWTSDAPNEGLRPACFVALALDDLRDRMRDLLQEVAGRHADGSEATGSQSPRQAVQIS